MPPCGGILELDIGWLTAVYPFTAPATTPSTMYFWHVR
jgi:hypothetical protein